MITKPKLKIRYPELENFKAIVLHPNFNESDFPQLNEVLQRLFQNLKEEDIPDLRQQIHTILGKENIEESAQGFAIRKPHGYAGDFECIDMVYREQTHHKPEIAIWDKYYHNCPAARAVKNRKAFFKYIINKNQKEGKLDVLNIASGPCRDVLEYFEETSDRNLFLDCLDMDGNAIDFAKNLTKAYSDNINFIHKNIFRFHPNKQYDIVWSAGLFDYFSDAMFIRLLKRMSIWLKDGGKIVVGNFSDTHPTQGYMEVVLDWKLNLRSEAKLREIALAAGFKNAKISVEKEAQKVNLFLIAEK